MTLEDEIKLLISGYYGISEMDVYTSKEYILKQLEDYIREFVKTYLLNHLDYHQICQELEKQPLKTKLQDGLLILNRIQAPLELHLLMKEKIREIESEK